MGACAVSGVHGATWTSAASSRLVLGVRGSRSTAPHSRKLLVKTRRWRLLPRAPAPTIFLFEIELFESGLVL